MKKYIYCIIIGLALAGIILFAKNNNSYIAVKLYQALRSDETNLMLARDRIACEESAKFINESCLTSLLFRINSSS